MAVSMGQVSVGTTSTAVVSTAKGGTLVLAHRGTAVSIYVGHGTVTTANGLALEQGNVVSFPVAAGFSLNGIVAAATEELHYLLIE